MDRDEVKQRVVAIARDLHTLAVSSYGPTGRVKVLQPNEDSPDAVEVTTIAERICNRVGVSECPVANVYLHILKSRMRSHSDGGLLTMLLSSKLQLAAQDGILSDIPPHLVVQGFHLALQWCIAYLDDPSCPVRVNIDWSASVGLCAVLRGMIGSKPVATSKISADDSLVDMLPLLVEAFVSVLPFVTQHSGESIPIRFLHDAAFASSLRESRILKNSVLLNLQHHTSDFNKLHLRTNVRVLLFAVSLDPTGAFSQDEDDTNGTSVVLTRNFQESKEVPATEMALQRLGDEISATGVKVVLSQKLIPTILQSYLAKKGILSVARLGITHMRAVQLLTGATALGDWRTIAISKFGQHATGFLSSVSVMHANHQDWLLLQNDSVQSPSAPNSWPVSTLVLSAHNEHAYTELVHVITTCFKRLEALMEEPEVIAGGGCTEIHLAAWLRRHAEHLVVDCQAYDQAYGVGGRARYEDLGALRKLRCVVNAFAEVLESVVVALDHGVHGFSDEVTQTMRDANIATLHELPDNRSYSVFGWDPVCGEPIQVATFRQRGSQHSVASSEGESTSDEDAESDDGDDENKSRTLVSAHVLDVLSVKKNALMTAVECATTLLRIAGVIHTVP